jgi:hypothetical protein
VLDAEPITFQNKLCPQFHREIAGKEFMYGCQTGGSEAPAGFRVLPTSYTRNLFSRLGIFNSGTMSLL